MLISKPTDSMKVVYLLVFWQHLLETFYTQIPVFTCHQHDFKTFTSKSEADREAKSDGKKLESNCERTLAFAFYWFVCFNTIDPWECLQDKDPNETNELKRIEKTDDN